MSPSFSYIISPLGTLLGCWFLFLAAPPVLAQNGPCDWCDGQGVFLTPEKPIPTDPLPDWAQPFEQFLGLLPAGLPLTCGLLNTGSDLNLIPADQCEAAQGIDELKEL